MDFEGHGIDERFSLHHHPCFIADRVKHSELVRVLNS
ncbi:hypothetical protein C5167_026893 [Papaver somniferum]|nr:hypothetical protein C5167_026893 [Papaver somniferum]